MKRCKDCGKEKELSEFYNSKSGRDGKYAFCKSCHNARNVQYAVNSSFDKKAAEKKWKMKHPGRQKRYFTKCYTQGAPCFIANALGITMTQLTPELLELKRAQLEMLRLTRQLKKEIQNGN